MNNKKSGEIKKNHTFLNKISSQRNKLKIPLRILLIGLAIIFLFFLAKELIANAESIERIARSTGTFAPIILICVISLGILFTPIPSVIYIMTAGYLYGGWWGALYSYLGHLLAAISMFAATNLLKIKTENKHYNKYKNLIEENRKILYLLYSVPLLPVSIITIFAASSNLKWKQFLKIIFIGFLLPVIFFSFFGNRISNQNLLEIAIFISIIVIGIIFTIKRIKKKSHFKKL